MATAQTDGNTDRPEKEREQEGNGRAGSTEHLQTVVPLHYILKFTFLNLVILH